MSAREGEERTKNILKKNPPTISPTGSSVLLTPVDYLSGQDKQKGDQRHANRTRF